MSLRRLVVVLGDQLDADSAAFDGFDPAQDAVWMCEARAVLPTLPQPTVLPTTAVVTTMKSSIANST